LNTVANTAGASAAGASFSEVFGEENFIYFAASFTLCVLLFTEILPKTLGVTFAHRLAVPVAYVVSFLAVVFTPVIWVTRLFSRFLRGKGESQAISLEDIRLLTALGATEGAVGARVAQMIEGATKFRERKARDVMVPRSGVVFLSGQFGVVENLELVRLSGHSRFPFSRSGNLDEVDGIVVAKDLMFQLRDVPGEPMWEHIMTKPVMVPGSTPLERLLRTFQDERKHMAIVLDEYGGTMGIVTMEDVLEEIVGEIEDESDRVNPFITKRPDGSLICRAWAEVQKVFEVLGLPLEKEQYSVSLGGFVAELVGRIPRVGDRPIFKGFEFIVLQASPRRSELIEIRKLTESLSEG
jgi:CBS domain containing-hemolysin-like protein